MAARTSSGLQNTNMSNQSLRDKLSSFMNYVTCIPILRRVLNQIYFTIAPSMFFFVEISKVLDSTYTIRAAVAFPP